MRTIPDSVKVEDVSIETDRSLIRGHLRTPIAGNLIGAVVIHPATAVPERLYSAFADYLCGEGFAVLTYDYRGTGESGRPRENRDIRMRDWMMVDVPATAAWMRSRFPSLPQLAVGHSIGGHALSLNYGSEDLAGFATIAAHAGVTATIKQPIERARVGLVLRVLGPASSRILGYVPGRRLGLGEDMPGAAMLEWSKWSRKPGYFFDDPTMDAAARAANVRGDVLVIGFTDDLWATPGQVNAISDHLTSAEVERRTLDPHAVGVAAAIGHMGFFRRANGAALWGDVSAWLAEHAKSSS